MRRVVVTGMAGVTALGESWGVIRDALAAGRTAVQFMEEWVRFSGVNTRLAAPIHTFSIEDRYPRKKMRTMGRVSQLAVYATELALVDAGLLDNPLIRSMRTGIAYGSSFGSPGAMLEFSGLMKEGTSHHINATSYIRLMSHTAAVNIGTFFGVTGRFIPTSSACTSGSQGIGYAYEAIRWGKADVMIGGGAEELDIAGAAVFDTLYATSTRNHQPDRTPRPFDRDRDGLVTGEGAATFILEEYEHARARGARMHAEIVGFGCNADGNHVTQPQSSTMQGAMRLALEDAGLPPEAIGVINGHGTATEAGDIAESSATHAVFGPQTPFHSLKGHLGHTLGACGAIETWLGIEMMRDDRFYPTANLELVDERCAPLDYILGAPRSIGIDHLVATNFAFGGINTAIVVKRM